MTQTPDFRLGIVCSVPAVRDAAGNLTCNHAIGRLLDQLRKSIPGAELAIPVLSVGHKSMKHKLEFKPEEITELPPLKTVMGSQRHFFATRRILRDFASRFDVLFVRVPFQVPLALRHLGKPKLLHVISNPYQVITASSDYRGLMRALAVRLRRSFECHDAATRRRARHARSHQRRRDVGIASLPRRSCGRLVLPLRTRDATAQDLSLGQPPRILFVGYLRPEKGIRYLLEAFESLRKRRHVKLTLVGGTDRATGSEAETHEQIRKSPYRDDISIVGMVDFGQPLFDLYRNHDVMVVPSLSEGTPRTIVERVRLAAQSWRPTSAAFPARFKTVATGCSCLRATPRPWTPRSNGSCPTTRLAAV